jgi:O-methyltransferase
LAERVRRLISRVVRGPAADPFLSTATQWERDIVARALPDSITSAQRVVALIDAVRYCVRRDLPGAFAECGVWRGGSVMAMIWTLQALGRDDRDIYLYDTFEGMTRPSQADDTPVGPHALETWKQAQRTGDRPWPHFFAEEVFNEDIVRDKLRTTGYPQERLHLVRGRVEDTLPEHAPEQLALLRLDTDWYESTRHELEHLYPRLVEGGVLIVDDYGHWAGARKAVDEYFGTFERPPLLTRIDYTGRIGIKA